MTSYINIKNKQGLTKLASLIKQAGLDDVKVTVKPNKSIVLTPGKEIDLSAGIADLKARRYIAFKEVDDAIDFLAKRTKKSKKSVIRKK
jgi:hypothetical protein